MTAAAGMLPPSKRRRTAEDAASPSAALEGGRQGGSASKVGFELHRRRRIEELRGLLRERLGASLRGHAFAQDGSGELLEAIEPPRESFNRWLFSGDAASLEGEILDDLPVKLRNWYPTEVDKQRENVRSWRVVMRKWWTEHKYWEDSDALQDFIFSEDLESIPYSANEIRAKTRAAIEPVVGPIVRGIVGELAALRDAARLRFAPAAVSSSSSSSSPPPSSSAAAAAAPPGSDAAQAKGEAPAEEGGEGGGTFDVAADFDPLKKLYVLSAEGRDSTGAPVEESFKISQWAYDKLSELFVPGLTSCSFWEEAFCCLCRYEALCGSGGAGAGAAEGAGLQAALPQEVFDLLPEDAIEAFASPFNVSRSSSSSTSGGRGRYHRYCSVFNEDRVFGSLGNFFEQVRDLSDVRRLGEDVLFECNPPFDVFLMGRLVERAEALLEAAEKAAPLGAGVGGVHRLRFLFAFPEWQTNSFRTESPITKLQASRFLLDTRVRRPHQHRYVKGRCWTWSKLPEVRGPPLAPGVSKSRITLLGAKPLAGVADADGQGGGRAGGGSGGDARAEVEEAAVGTEASAPSEVVQEARVLLDRICKAW